MGKKKSKASTPDEKEKECVQDMNLIVSGSGNAESSSSDSTTENDQSVALQAPQSEDEQFASQEQEQLVENSSSDSLSDDGKVHSIFVPNKSDNVSEEDMALTPEEIEFKAALEKAYILLKKPIEQPILSFSSQIENLEKENGMLKSEVEGLEIMLLRSTEVIGEKKKRVSQVMEERGKQFDDKMEEIVVKTIELSKNLASKGETLLFGEDLKLENGEAIKQGDDQITSDNSDMDEDSKTARAKAAASAVAQYSVSKVSSLAGKAKSWWKGAGETDESIKTQTPQQGGNVTSSNESITVIDNAAAIEQSTLIEKDLVIVKPSIEKLSIEKLSIEKPSIEKPSIEKPSIEKPSIEKPSIEKPSIEKPSIEKPSIEKPSIKKPTPPEEQCQPSSNDANKKDVKESLEQDAADTDTKESSLTEM